MALVSSNLTGSSEWRLIMCNPEDVYDERDNDDDEYYDDEEF
jgi:hypothetical protein